MTMPTPGSERKRIGRPFGTKDKRKRTGPSAWNERNIALCEDYLSGLSLRATARVYGISMQRVHEILIRFGVLRRRKWHRKQARLPGGGGAGNESGPELGIGAASIGA
jgi:hypothetical protein